MLLCVGAIFALTSAYAAAAPTWLAPTTFQAADERPSDVSVASDPAGDTVVVWESYRADLSQFVTQAAMRPAGGSWEAPVTLAESHDGVGTDVAMDPQGDVTVALSLSAGSGESSVEVIQRPRGGSWQTPTTLSAPGEVADLPQLAVDGHGDTVVAWDTSEGSAGDVVRVSEREAGREWEAPATMSPVGQDGLNQVLIAEDRRALVFWDQDLGSGHKFEAWSAERAPGGTWGDAEARSNPAEEGFGGRAVVDPQGDVTDVWVEGTDLEAATKPAGGVWPTPVQIGESAYRAYLAVDQAGRVTAVWPQELSAYHYLMRSSIMTPGSGWGAPATVAETTYPDYSIAESPQGEATVVWSAFASPHWSVWDARRTSAGLWQSPAELSQTEENWESPQVAADGQGDVTAAWGDTAEGHGIFRAAAYDAAGPELNDLVVPASGTVGIPVSFAVSPFDVWSPLSQTSWSFGDGSSGQGLAVTHAYTASGTYTVQLTSSDAVGNATQASAEITIAPAGGTGSPGGTAHASGAPTISGLSESHRRWREGSTAARIARRRAKPPVGTSFGFTLSSNAKVTFTFAQSLPGQEVSGRCRARVTGSGHRSCRRSMTRGTLVYTVAVGHHQLSFQGRLSGHRYLPPGSYTAQVKAVGTASGQAATPHTLSFTIVR